jgi:drug/metabolite transporter (DMT)-like permease
MTAQDNVIAADPVTPSRVSRLWIPGAGLGFLGVLTFSFSLPANKLAVAGIDPFSITILRAAAAGILAVVYLLAVRARVPRWADLRDLALSSLGVVIGFPLFSSLALMTSGSGHSAVIVGLLPALTAVFAALVGGERLPRGFWLATCGGVLVLVAYLFAHQWAETGTFSVGIGDLWMLAAAVSAGYGYAMGGRQAKVMGGARAVSWSIVIVLPISAPLAILVLATQQFDWTPGVIVGMVYVTLFSQFLGFFAWYGGLAKGGIARVGQLQQIQPLLTLAWAALLLGEVFDPWTILVGVVIAVFVWLAQRARFAAPVLVPAAASEEPVPAE